MNLTKVVRAGELMVQGNASVDPRKFATEVFDLYSIPAFDSGTPEVVTGMDIGSSKQVVDPSDVLLSKIVPHIRRAWVVGARRERRQIASGEWIVFRSERVFPGYLRHALVSDGFHLQFMQTVSGVGGSLMRARPAYVANIDIPLPSLPEQRRIAEVLDRAETLRTQRRQALAQLDALAEAIFLDMFGDPVTNPKGWPRKSAAVLGRVVTGNTPSRANASYYGSAIEWIKSDNLNTPHDYATLATEHLSEAGRAVARLAPAGSILVTCIAGSPECIGNAAMVNREVAFNQQINAFIPTEGCLDFWFAQFIVGKRLIQAASTEGMKGMVSKSRFERIELIAPPEPLQRAFAERRGELARLKSVQAKALEELDALFASLQHRAFRGEL